MKLPTRVPVKDLIQQLTYLRDIALYQGRPGTDQAYSKAIALCKELQKKGHLPLPPPVPVRPVFQPQYRYHTPGRPIALAADMAAYYGRVVQEVATTTGITGGDTITITS
jgi:hypothetical protein